MNIFQLILWMFICHLILSFNYPEVRFKSNVLTVAEPPDISAAYVSGRTMGTSGVLGTLPLINQNDTPRLITGGPYKETYQSLNNILYIFQNLLQCRSEYNLKDYFNVCYVTISYSNSSSTYLDSGLSPQDFAISKSWQEFFVNQTMPARRSFRTNNPLPLWAQVEIACDMTIPYGCYALKQT